MQYIGFDIHKKYTFYTQMDATGQIQRQGKLTSDRAALATFFGGIADPTRVVIEASMNWYHPYDLLETLDIPVTLAHPLRTRAIAEARIKTDRVDSTILAHLLRTDLVPAAYIPPREIRDLRELLRYRAALVRLQTILRWILIEASFHAARRPGRYQQVYQRLAQRKGAKLARVAVARELLTTIYWMLRHAR